MLRTPWHGEPICCAPHGMGDLYAAQTVGVSFHSFPGEGAASCVTAMKSKNNMKLCGQLFYLLPGFSRVSVIYRL
jgi:hypothetical protein